LRLTTITTIVSAAAGVVLVVAVAVPFVFRELACSETTLRVLALAICAVFFANRHFEGLGTAITAIPIATTVVVVVVAHFVPFEFDSPTFPCAELIFLSGFQALAFLAVLYNS